MVGLDGVIKQNKNLEIFIVLLLALSIYALFDNQISDRYIWLPIFFFIQTGFNFVYLLNIKTNHDQLNDISNIHYIRMPDEDSIHSKIKKIILKQI